MTVPTVAPARETPPEVLAFRARFPIFERRVHLVSNSKGALSDAVLAAHQEYLDSWREQGAPWHLWVERHEELRAAFAALIGAKPGEVAVCPSVSAALGAVASALDWGVRPGVVFDDYSFPTVTYLWHAQAARGARIGRVAPDGAGELSVERFVPAVDSSTRVVSVAHVCYKNGHRLDLPAVADVAHEAGALLVVDDYQCTGSRPLDVRAAGIDVLATGTVKFLLGSPGIGLLYVREELFHELHPVATGWFGQRDPNDFQIERHEEAPDAARFQAGTPAIPAVFDSLAGIELVRSVGLERIGAWVDRLTALARARLLEEGFVPATPFDPAKRGPQVAVRTHDMERVVAELERRDVIVTSRDGNLRAAFHYYNTPDDVEAFVAALKEIEPLLVRSN
jgi:selenocysteine lyase/cysteine desulfurase